MDFSIWGVQGLPPGRRGFGGLQKDVALCGLRQLRD